MSVKPSLPKGTRDMLPKSMLEREFIIDSIKKVFKKYSFSPIETPAMENISTLSGKYGDEGDRLIFKILNSGDFLAKADKNALESLDSKSLTSSISEKALRYDLTVPFARFVVQNQNEINFPFKRYQIQPVWRADRPQKGRFREFFQCDADVIGSNSLLLELEFVKIYDEVFSSLGLDVDIRINNRKILAGLASVFGVENKWTDFTITLDKLDKVGWGKLSVEFLEMGITQANVDKLEKIFIEKRTNAETFELLKNILETNQEGSKGLEELKFVLDNIQTLNIQNDLSFDPSLARGLNYYTGAIFEVVANGVELGSIGGGGRYDELTAIFGLKGISGIGVSFGLDRIQIALGEKNLYPKTNIQSTEIMFLNFGEEEALFGLKLATELRDLGVKTEVYPDKAKIKKQMDFANKNNVKYVVLLGKDEMESGEYTIKNMESGDQFKLSRIELLEKFNLQNKRTDGKH